MSNPLLEDNPLPAFSRIRPEHAAAAVKQLLAEHRGLLQSLLEKPGERTWETLFQPLEEKDDQLERAWSPIRHLHAVADSDALRGAYNDCLPLLTDHATALGQNEELYRACKAVADGEQFAQLHYARRKAIDNALRDFRLAGVESGPREKDRCKTLRRELARLQARFEENLLDATQAWTKRLTDPTLLRGLPDTAIESAAQAARQRNQQGWLLTLEFPSYQPVMVYAENRELRRELYLAYNTRASELGPHAGRWDNGPLMADIVARRRELAELLGFRSYAEYSLAKKMAGSPQEVMEFLESLAAHGKPVAQEEMAELQDFAAREHGVKELQAWDVPYYSEQLQRRQFDFSQEELRPYFPAEQVIAGLFAVAHRLFGIAITPRDGVDAWHPDVSFFDVRDEQGQPRGGFYLDLYARPHKRGGAWMDECVTRRRSGGGVQRPVAYLTCNFTPPVDGRPSLLTHEEALTLFHEFGHGLHHILTLVDCPAVAGINGVPWDAVELPSQFLENWCWEREALGLFARHVGNGKPLPGALFSRMRRARRFHSGMHLARQLELALFDFRLHHERRGQDAADIQALLDEVRRTVAVVKAPPDNRFQHSFSHVFANGYAAGYYSYQWADVLAADAFSRFEEDGVFDAAAGREFLHNILEQGGAQEPMDLFTAFRGRRPTVDALLARIGRPEKEDE